LTFPEKIPVSYELKHLLRGLLCKTPNERLGAEGGIAAIMIHPWFKNVNFIALLQKKIIPPFKPNSLKFNFDSNDLIKGELETREKLLGKSGLA
jgi:serum/glucocorticoid-regulated kinase 2